MLKNYNVNIVHAAEFYIYYNPVPYNIDIPFLILPFNVHETQSWIVSKM